MVPTRGTPTPRPSVNGLPDDPRKDAPQTAVAQVDLQTLLEERMKKRAVGIQLILAVVTSASGVLMISLAFVSDTYLRGRLLFFLFGVFGLLAAVWLVALMVTAGSRTARLLDDLEHHPDRIERIYAGVTRRMGLHAAPTDVVPAPEREHLGEGGTRWYVYVTRRGSTPWQRFLGLSSESIPVSHDEVLPLLDWLRAKAPGAAGPPRS